ncbi:hypothetical protein F-S17_0239 [Faustovirus]|nr:hypothetical protein F-S17_0239 [Faustovirus]
MAYLNSYYVIISITIQFYNSHKIESHAQYM